MINIADYIDPNLIIFLDAENRDEALKALVDSVFASKKINSKENFLNAIISREDLVSTGIGMGVAIPHSKLSTCDDFFIAIGLLKKGVDWNSLDGGSVRIIFLIGGPDDKQTEYLQILSALTVAIKDEERRKKILTLNSQEAIMKLFKVEVK